MPTVSSPTLTSPYSSGIMPTWLAQSSTWADAVALGKVANTPDDYGQNSSKPFTAWLYQTTGLGTPKGVNINGTTNTPPVGASVVPTSAGAQRFAVYALGLLLIVVAIAGMKNG